MISRPEPPIQTFPYKALQDGKIIYTHDGSETLTDQFTVVAVAQTFEENLSGIGSGGGTSGSRRLSIPHVVHIKVVPTNDQVPTVVNNTGTSVWVGGTVTITNKELGECSILDSFSIVCFPRFLQAQHTITCQCFLSLIFSMCVVSKLVHNCTITIVSDILPH